MNNKDYQIIVKGEDKTDNTGNLREIGNKIEITFCNSEKGYTYQKQDEKIIPSALLSERTVWHFTKKHAANPARRFEKFNT